MIPDSHIAKKLIKDKKTLSLAESCTGGLLANRLTNIPGSSKFLKLGIITYSNEAKTKILAVPKKILTKYGAVSECVAKLMAQNVRRLLKTDFAIGISGIAGPKGATKNKPVGLTYIAISTEKQTFAYKFIFKGQRVSIKNQAATKALRLLLCLI